MSGSNGDREGETLGTRVGESDPCKKSYRGPINSPKPAVLSKLTIGSVLDVTVQMVGTAPILVVIDNSGAAAGSLTFVGYLTLIDCIQNRSAAYKATILSIAGGVYEVRVEPC